MDRRGDRPGGGGGDRGGGAGGDVGRRMPSRWSSGSPTNDNFPPRGGDRFPRGEGRGGGGFGGGSGGGGGRFHPYRGPQDYPTGGGAGGPGFRGGPGGFGHQGPMGGGGSGPKRGFFGRGGSPDYADGNKVAKLFIGSVPRTATEEDIRPLFEEHGNVIEVALIRDRRTGQQQGFCFIKYATTEEADRAIAALHNQYTLPGAVAPLQVRYADGDRERHGPVEDKLFVASLNKRATEQEIAEIFTPYGHVEDVYLMRDDLKQSRGCGFVKFASRDMAAAAMNALHGTYTMRGCDQPLIVRFADPKRPRPDPRGGPAFGGPGFGHRSEESTMARPPSNFDVPMGGRLPPNAWGPVSPQQNGPSSLARTHGFGSNSSAKGGGAMEASSSAAGSFGDTGGPASGSQPNLAATPLSQQGFNPPMGQTNPAVGQQMPPLQKSFVPSQHLPTTSMQPHNNQNFASYSQGHALQAPMQQLGQHQFPHSVGLPSSQTVPSQQLPGLAGQLSISQPLIQQNASAAGTQNQLGLQQQGMAAVANQQQMPASSISHQLHQRPVQQLPSQFPQALLQQQAQALQSSFQSSQQALLQLQQQVQLMQQSSQQQFSQNAKQQSTWSGPHTTSGTPVSAPAVVMPSAASATSVPVTTASVVPLTCNWTEHTSPEGFKYYYNGVTGESKWEKPEEYLIFEQQQQQQKLLLLQQQQQKLAVQQLQSPAQTTSDSQVHPTQQISQTQQQVMSQMQLRQQAQLQLLQPSLAYQASGATGNPSVQGFNYAQLQAVGSVTDPARFQQGQGVQAAPDAWQTKPAGS